MMVGTVQQHYIFYSHTHIYLYFHIFFLDNTGRVQNAYLDLEDLSEEENEDMLPGANPQQQQQQQQRIGHYEEPEVLEVRNPPAFYDVATSDPSTYEDSLVLPGRSASSAEEQP